MYAGEFPQASAEARKMVDEGSPLMTPICRWRSAQSPTASSMRRAKPYAQMAKVDDSAARSPQSVSPTSRWQRDGRQMRSRLLQAGIAADRQRQNNAGVATKELALADALGMHGQRESRGRGGASGAAGRIR
jgi:hypothetical protein